MLYTAASALAAPADAKREELKGLVVVHGHTPNSFDPEIYPHRINVDTGAVFGGPLPDPVPVPQLPLPEPEP